MVELAKKSKALFGQLLWPCDCVNKGLALLTDILDIMVVQSTIAFLNPSYFIRPYSAANSPISKLCGASRAPSASGKS